MKIRTVYLKIYFKLERFRLIGLAFFFRNELSLFFTSLVQRLKFLPPG